MPERYRIKLRDEEPWELAKTTNNVNLLKQLSEDENKWVRGGVALNPKTSVNMLKKLSEDKDWYVRESVASNLNTPADVLIKLSNDKDRDVRTAVAKNPNTSVDILRQLSKDKDRVVRKAVASNSNTTVDILEILAEDEDKDVRIRVASNLNCSEELLRRLAEDEDEYVRREVAKNQSKKFKISKQNDNWKVKDIGPSGIEGLHIYDDEYPELPAFSCILSGKGYEFELPQVYCMEADGEVHEDEGGYNGYWGVPIIDLNTGEEFKSDVNLDSIAEEISDYIGLDCEEDIVKVLEDASKKYYRSGKWKHAITDSKFKDSKLRDTPRVNTLGVTSIKRSPYVKLAIKHDNQNDLIAYNNVLEEAYKDLEYDLSNLGNSRMRKELKITYLPLFKHISSKVSKTNLERQFLRLYNTI